MEDRSIGSRLWRRGAMALPVVVAALAFAQAASATTGAPVVYTPTNSATLSSDVTTADSAAPGTLSIIQLCGCLYEPTSELTLDGNIEITGPPTYQTGSTGATSQDPQINGQLVYNLSPAEPTILVNAGANVVLKGFDLSSAGNGVLGGIEANGGSTTEVDNMAIDGSAGPAIQLNSGANMTVSNALLGDGDFFGVSSAGSAVINMINDSIWDNNNGGVAGNGIHLYNDLFVSNEQGGTGFNCQNIGTGFIASGTWSDDTSCGTAGVTYDPNLPNYMDFTDFNGGPSESAELVPGSGADDGGNATYCPTNDQRFFLYTKGSGGTCDPGSYQESGVQDTSTSGPACTVSSVNESTNPSVASTEVVDAQEASGIGMGADSVQSYATNNGTVMWPTVGSSWFNATSPSLTVAEDYPSTAAYPVTAAKPVGDLTVNDTMWSFYASDWLGNTTYCH